MGRKTHKQRTRGMPRWVKEQKEFDARSGRFPGCRGTFPDCPESVDANNVAEQCKKCPKYKGL
ncbi:MAG: hypothetical protein NTV63_04365 [Candidatus Woesearchaeota archaeon]|nr:hypothetical protein [Candidatus Woesearchaeota archaeon]